MLRNVATGLNIIPEIKTLDDFDVLPIVDETSAVARPPGSLDTAAISGSRHRHEPGVSDVDIFGDEEAVIFSPQSKIVPLGRRRQLPWEIDAWKSSPAPPSSSATP